ncbi:MAG: hypothetical protein PHC61_16475, partial [Chitinivibrionales bacterium]|nr:hypothetical protein [Chitinivibrionales bacterium]
MRRFTIRLLIAISVIVLVFFAAIVALFYRNINGAGRIYQSRMLAMAAYIAVVADRAARGGMPADSIDAQLDELTSAGGFERAVMVDAEDRVLYKSQSILGRGDVIGAYLVDSAAFRAARAGFAPRLSPVKKIEGVYFQSLYYPCTLEGRPCMEILESDQHYYIALERFQTSLTV